MENTKACLWPAIILVTSFLLALNFLEFFPNGWDQAEYAWCLKRDYLPHSPYILYFLLGKLSYWVLRDAARALSALSLVSGLGSLILLHLVNLRLFGSEGASEGPRTQQIPRLALLVSVATLLMGTNYLFVRQSSTQEVYVVQLFFALLSAFFLLDRRRGATALGGMACGCAIATHNASVFLVPGMVFLVLITAGRRKQPYCEPLIGFGVSTAVTVAVFYSIIYFLLPSSPLGDQPHYYLTYMRGIAPGIDPARILNPSFLRDSLSSLLHRLVSQEITHGRLPRATFPIGITVFHLLLVVSGIVLSWRANYKPAVFWLLWSLPYLGYEILMGNTVDFGVYIVFLLPCLMPFLAFSVMWLMGKAALGINRGKVVAWSVVVALTCLLFLPSLVHFVKHWDDLKKDAVEHYSASVLAAIGSAEILPANSTVIQPRDEWNVNLLPYYADRRHVLRNRNRLAVLRDLGPFTPMNITSYELLTTLKLKALITSGSPVYAFEADPLYDSPRDIIDRRAFRWTGDTPVDLDEVKARLRIREDIRQRLPGGTFTLYRGSTVEKP